MAEESELIPRLESPWFRDVSTKKAQPIKNFEEGLEKLEALVEEMEDGSLPLEKLVTHYEKGTQLLEQCDLKLKEAEKTIEILRTKSVDGPIFEKLER